jgi:hypothetical protein
VLEKSKSETFSPFLGFGDFLDNLITPRHPLFAPKIEPVELRHERLF